MGLQGLSALGSSFLLADGVQLTWALRSSLGSASLIDASHSTLSQPLLGGSSAFATLFSVQPPSSLEATEANSVPGAVLLDVLEHIQMQCALPRPYDDIITPDVMHKYAIAHSLIMQVRISCRHLLQLAFVHHTHPSSCSASMLSTLWLQLIRRTNGAARSLCLCKMQLTGTCYAPSSFPYFT
jgi:hypothetical protein